MRGLKKISWAHPGFYIPLIFMLFPLIGPFGLGYPLWTLPLTVCYIPAYLYLVHGSREWLINLLWTYCLIYIYVTTVYGNGGMFWFIYMPSNLIIYRFPQIKHYRFYSFLALIISLEITVMIFSTDFGSRVMSVVIPVICFVFMAYFYQMMEKERHRAEQERQNAYINLLVAENERNRIGRDLHDSLGHVFAMMTLKLDLASKQLEKGDSVAVQTQLTELSHISRTSMSDVRKLIDTLKYRTIDEELDIIREMLAMVDINVEVRKNLDTSALSPVVQSSLTMVLRELVTNIIKHANAKNCQLSLYRRENQVFLEVRDDGCGFKELTGKELKSVNDRLLASGGEVTILSPQKPTHIRVSVTEGER